MDVTHHIRHSRHYWLSENISLVMNTSPAYSTESSDSTFTTDDTTNATVLGVGQTANQSRSGVDPVVYIYAASFLIVVCTVSLAVNVVILSSVCFMRSRIYPTLYISLSLAGADTFSLFFYALGLLFFTLLPMVLFHVGAMFHCSRIYPTLYISLSLAGADTFSLFFYALGLLFFTLLPMVLFHVGAMFHCSRIYPTLYISLSLAGADTFSLFFYALGLLFFTLLPMVLFHVGAMFHCSRVYPTLYISLSLAGADTFSLFFYALGLLFFTLLPMVLFHVGAMFHCSRIYLTLYISLSLAGADTFSLFFYALGLLFFTLLPMVLFHVGAMFHCSRIYPTLYISLSLAGADTFSLFFYALGLLFFTLLPRLGVSFEAPCAMLVLEALRMGAIMTTLFHLAALAGNHYLGILLPLHYPVYMARRNIQYCIVVLWTIPSSLLVLDMFFLEGDGFKMCPYLFLMRSRFRTRFSIPFFMTLGMMIFIYLHIYKLVCKHQKEPLDGKYPRYHSHKRSGGFSKSQVNEKAIVTTLMILGSTIFGWTPAFTYYALICEDCIFREYWNLRTPGEVAVMLVVNFLMICKTATNSYIYAFRMKEIKVALRRMRRRLLMCLFANRADYDQSDWAAGGLTRTASRQSTSRSRTFVYRMNSLQDNGVTKQPPVDPSLRRCRSVTFSKNKRCSTSV